MSFFSNLVVDIESFIKTLLHVAPAVESAFPNAAGGVENAVITAKKAELATQLVHVVMPELAAGKTSEEVAHINDQITKLVPIVAATKAAYDAVNTPPAP